jgi:protein-tyrosine phosphatase
MIDLHCHILPAIDDGPETSAQTIELARAAAAAGTRTMVATPHVSGRYPNRPGPIADAVAEVNGSLRGADLDFVVLPGAEIALTQLDVLNADELAGLRLGGGPYLLIESSFDIVVDIFPNVLAALQDAGHAVVMAHPERCPGFHRHPDVLRQLAENGALNSVTAASFTGRFGRQVQAFTLAMAREGLVHNVASDAHDLLRRPPEIASHLEAAGLGRYTELLTIDTPHAILTGDPLPPRPDTLVADQAPRRRFWRRAARAGD